LIAQNDVRLIYGGSSLGLMGKLSDSVMSHGGQVTGIISRSLLVKEKPLETLDELIITETIQERKLWFCRKKSWILLKFRHFRLTWMKDDQFQVAPF